MSSRSAVMHRIFGAALAAAALIAPARAALAQQKNDEEYTKQIKQFMRDPRITTELVDHLPASSTVPTPLKVLGHIIGAWGILDKSEDMNRYLASIAKAAPARAKYWTIGKTEEGRDMIVLVVGNEDIIRNLDKYKADLAALTDPRKTTEAQARALIKTAKPIYWITSGMHSPETGGPEMLMELAYRLVVEETPFIQSIRNNVITLITPVVEVDGREKEVDTYYYSTRSAPRRVAQQPLMYWGKYVAARQQSRRHGAVPRAHAEHRRSSARVAPDDPARPARGADASSTRRPAPGPYNDAARSDHDRRVVDARRERRDGDDQARRARRVDVRVLRRLGAELHVLHRARAQRRSAASTRCRATARTLRRCARRDARARSGSGRTRRCRSITWGPRNNTNIQESAMLFALNHVAKNSDTYPRELLAQEQARGRQGHERPDLRLGDSRRRSAARPTPPTRSTSCCDQGLEFHTATAAFKAGNVDVKAGDYIVRGDQPYRTLADMYFSLQNYPPQQPVAVRRHRLDVPADARHHDHAGHRQVAARRSR